MNDISLADALYHLKFNPFEYGGFLASFYSELKGVENNLLLSQLVIPICSHPDYSRKLANAVFGPKNKSTIWTRFDEKDAHSLQERVNQFKKLTSLSLHYCLINKWIEIKPESLSISYLDSNSEKKLLTMDRSAKNLGKLFSHHQNIEIYSLLGVNPI